jgi:hypothetical protein
LHSQLGIWPCKLLLSMLRFVSDARLDTEMQAARFCRQPAGQTRAASPPNPAYQPAKLERLYAVKPRHPPAPQSPQLKETNELAETVSAAATDR